MSLKNLFARLFRHDLAKLSVPSGDFVKDRASEPGPSSELADGFPTLYPIDAPHTVAPPDLGSSGVLDEPATPALSVAVATPPREINCIELIYSVMDHIYPYLVMQYGLGVDQQIGKALQEFRSQFKALNERRPIPYDTPVRQFAYLYLYASVRASVMHNVMTRFAPLSDLLDRNELRVCCLGGGPGTDLLGLAKYMSSVCKSTKITAAILDKHASWNTCWQAIEQRLPTMPDIDAQYMQQDFTAPSSWHKSPDNVGMDLYTLSYCLAEFRGRSYQAEPYLQKLFRYAPAGSYVLFMDVDYSDEYLWFDRMMQAVGFEPLPDVNGNRDGRCQTNLLSIEEERSAQHGYKGKWPGITPRTDPKVAYRLCRKVS